MTATKKKNILFDNQQGRDFYTVLKQRVAQSFKKTQSSYKANLFMCLKSCFLMSVVLLGYLLLISGIATSALGIIGLYVLLGFLVAMGAMNVAHDALHGAYVTGTIGNRLIGFVMDLFGTSSFYWKKEHTVDHHTFTNIVEHDADLNVPIVLRLCPRAPWRSFHKYQRFYAPLLYSINLIRWVYYSDPRRIIKAIKAKMAGEKSAPVPELALMVLFKVVHVFLFIALPLMLLPVSPWVVIVGYLCLLSTMGLTLTTIFQLAHIVENVAFPSPDAHGKIDNSFILHQLQTTSNFATKSKVVNFLFGGLNFQIEHHLFPYVCHIHLHKLSPIVRETAKEFGLMYYENKSFFTAIRSHFRTLKRFGDASSIEN